MKAAPALVANVFAADCPAQLAIERIADKWTVIVIHALNGGTRRHGELRKEIGGISQKMLTQTLRHLESDGFVSRRTYPTVPPRVEYSLTPLGQSLTEPLAALCRWAETHIDELEGARARRRAAARS